LHPLTALYVGCCREKEWQECWYVHESLQSSLIDGIVGNEASANKKEVNTLPSRIFEEFRKSGKINFIRI
jgi:pentatricopeptide repeat protein